MGGLRKTCSGNANQNNRSSHNERNQAIESQRESERVTEVRRCTLPRAFFAALVGVQRPEVVATGVNAAEEDHLGGTTELVRCRLQLQNV